MAFAKQHGFEFYFNWETNRTEEGYFNVKGSVLYCVKRGIAYSDYADLLWMETPTPDVATATGFARGVRKVKPTQMLAYNLSPSFNWDAAKMTDQ
jgi:isocitrate lyase